jgi:hypothetical protein
MNLISRLRAVLLALVLLPLLTVAATPRAVSAQSTDHYLQLVSLKCIETEDWSGADEPYLKIAGVRAWGSDGLNDGETADLRGVAAWKLYARSQVDIALYEFDSPDGDDWLGTVVVSVQEQAGQGLRTISFTRDGAKYQLTYYIY